MRISDWSSDVCSSDLPALRLGGIELQLQVDRIAGPEARGKAQTIALGAARIAPGIDVETRCAPAGDRARSSRQAVVQIGVRIDIGSGQPDAEDVIDRRNLDRAFHVEAVVIAVPRREIAVLAIEFRRAGDRSEEHTSELQSLMRTSYAAFCLK